MRAGLATALGRFSLWLLKVVGRSGTTVPGRVALAVDPKFVLHRRSMIKGPVCAVSATNGKTTTSALLAQALGVGQGVVGNFAGANMAGGIAASLLSLPKGKDLAGVFEVDEFWLNELGPTLAPDALLLGNLFRDQLDRYGELDTIVDRWYAAVAQLSEAGSTFVACADDPGICWVLRDVPASQIVWFGCDSLGSDIGNLPHASDSGQCRSCGEKLAYDSVYIGHLGDWSCPSCGLSRPSLDLAISDFSARGARGFNLELKSASESISLSLGLPGLYNAYNAAGAWAMALQSGCAVDATRRVFEESSAAFGRGESFYVDGSEVQMLLIKNPTGANEVVRALAEEESGLTVQFCLNDKIADGRDISWIWDTDLEQLVGSVDTVICSGTRADEAALRFRYAGLDAADLSVIPDLRDGLKEAANRSSEVWVLPTYTAMVELRSRLSDEGLAEKVL